MEPAAYDEFSLFHENASEFGLPWPESPMVRRSDVVLADGGTLSALVWGSLGRTAAAGVAGPTDGAREAAGTGDGAGEAAAAGDATGAGEAPGAGDAPATGPLVFLHGTAMNAHTWDTVALALDRPIVAFDLPGHGRSSWREDSTYSPDNLAAAVAQGIDQLAPDAAGVIGMSLGGMTAMVLAAERPDLVRRLVLIDITPGTNREKAKAIVDFIDGPQTFPSFDAILARTIEHNPTRSESSLRRGILHNAHPLDDGSWAWNYDRRGRSQPRDDQPGIEPGASPLWDVLERVDVPVLLVRGGDSPVVDDDDVAELRRRQPSAEVVVVDGAGHSIQGDRPIELAAILQRFIP